MIGIIVTGHGNFASGLLSTVKLIAGEQEYLIGIDFLEENSTDELSQNIKEAIHTLGDDVVIFTDLAGGSPFNQSVKLKMEMKDKNIEVLSGTNFPMLLESLFTRTGMSASDLAKQAIESGRAAIHAFNPQAFVEFETSDEDGI
ncbi:MAG: fructose transporter subunit [Bacillales bacterium]|jgi:PTS system N-acetylgalactosamine-specific IIA component|nr:fructose transporter subunit [Bacillales bacterium]